jgi:glycosyltransferase involved in cell wall biosynthesis
MSPTISIIIPCYNSGEFLPEALASIKNFPKKELYEVIIINDGSTDTSTLNLLKQLGNEDYIILHQENKGPAAARNTGIRYSKGRYILFLDSDNKIKSEFIEKGISILDNRPDVGVVYGKPNFFGDNNANRQFFVNRIDPYSILKGNQVDMCSMIRKKVWEDVGGLDENRAIIGFEDWDFWLSITEQGWKFYFVDEVLYDYRIRANSLVMSASESNKSRVMRSYIYSKHLDNLLQRYAELHLEVQAYNYDKANPFRSFIKYLYYKYFSKGTK